MQLLYIALFVLGLTMTALGILWLVQTFSGKDIIEFPLAEKKKEFGLPGNGRYGVFIVGTKYLRKTGDFSARLRELSTSASVELTECTIKFKMSTPKRRMVEYFQFIAPHPGIYRIEFENIDQISTGMILMKSADRFGAITGTQLGILIKKTLPVSKKILSILLLTIGINLIVWGIILAFMPEVGA